MTTRTKMSRAEKIAFSANSPVYNQVRRAGHALGMTLDECVIGFISLEIGRSRADGIPTSATRVVAFCEECEADGKNRTTLTESQAAALLAAK